MRACVDSRAEMEQSCPDRDVTQQQDPVTPAPAPPYSDVSHTHMQTHEEKKREGGEVFLYRINITNTNNLAGNVILRVTFNQRGGYILFISKHS